MMSGAIHQLRQGAASLASRFKFLGRRRTSARPQTPPEHLVLLCLPIMKRLEDDETQVLVRLFRGANHASQARSRLTIILPPRDSPPGLSGLRGARHSRPEKKLYLADFR